MIEIVSEEAVERINLILHEVPGGAEKALKAVMQRATATVRKTTLEAITGTYDIKPKDIRDRKNTTINVRTKKINGGIVGTVQYSGMKIPLYRFGVSHKRPKTQGARVPINYGDGTWINVIPGAPVKARKRKDSPLKELTNNFIAKMRSGHIGIFERRGTGRFPISEKMGDSTAEMAGDTIVLEKVEAAAMETIAKRTEHEISRILHGYGGK